MTIAIVGVGLMGGSLALCLREKGIATTIIGVDENAANLQKALDLKMVDEFCSLDEALERSKVLVLAIHVDAVLEMLPGLLDKISDHIIIDLSSTKERILETVNGHPNRGRLVAAHPMAGTEYSGPEAAVQELYTNKTMVLCDVVQSDEDALDFVEELIDQLEMRLVFMSIKEHDLHTAYISHISHITSFALALTVLEKEKEHGHIFELAGSGFASTVRLAKSSPDMWIPIFRQNRNNVLDVLTEHINQLQNMKNLLQAGDDEALYKLVKKANRIRKIIK